MRITGHPCVPKLEPGRFWLPVTHFISAGRIYELRFEGSATSRSRAERLVEPPRCAPDLCRSRSSPRRAPLGALCRRGLVHRRRHPDRRRREGSGRQRDPGGRRCKTAPRYERRHSGAIGKLVYPREAPFDQSVASAADQAIASARNVEALFQRRVQSTSPGGGTLRSPPPLPTPPGSYTTSGPATAPRARSRSPSGLSRWRLAACVTGSASRARQAQRRASRAPPQPASHPRRDATGTGGPYPDRAPATRHIPAAGAFRAWWRAGPRLLLHDCRASSARSARGR